MAKEFRLPLDYKEKVGRAVHDFSLQKRTTMHPMLLYPLYGRQMKRGEKFIFSTPQILLQSLPTVSPLMGTWRLRIEWYFNSYANHYGWIDNNSRLSNEEVLNRRHHTVFPSNAIDTAFLDNIELRPSELRQYGSGAGSLADFAGVPVGYAPSETADYGSVFNLDFWLTYLNIVRCYHTNQQFPSVPYTAYGAAPSGDGTLKDYESMSQDTMDDVFRWLRFCDNGVKIDLANEVYNDPAQTEDVPYKYQSSLREFTRWLRLTFVENGGLFCSQYMPDLYRNLLPSDANLLQSDVTVNDDGSFSISTFRFANRLQQIYDRINPFGGKDSTISRTRWGVKSNLDYDIPELICVQTEIIDTTNITATAAGSGTFNNESVVSVPGDLSGKVDQRKFNNKKQSFTATTPGMLMAIVSLVPYVDYCQGIDRSLLLNNFEDEFSPQMAQRGFDDVPLSDYVSIPIMDQDNGSNESITRLPDFSQVVGKQVAWLSDMTAVNRVHGEFVRGREYETFVLTRNYLRTYYNEDTDISESAPYVSPYGFPTDWQYPFVGQSIDDPNWFLQVAFDIKSISPVGYRFMPTLE